MYGSVPAPLAEAQAEAEAATAQWACADTEAEYLTQLGTRPRGRPGPTRRAWQYAGRVWEQLGLLCGYLGQGLHDWYNDSPTALALREQLTEAMDRHGGTLRAVAGLAVVVAVAWLCLWPAPRAVHAGLEEEEEPAEVIVKSNQCPAHQLPIRHECVDRAGFLEAPTDRAFVVENLAPFKLWAALIGPGAWAERPHLTGFELEPGAVKVVPLPEGLASIRLWARTGCRWEDGFISRDGQNQPVKKFRCDTGDCGAVENMYGIQCRAIAGQPPATLAEFTLQREGNDFYDLSNVDGYNVGIRIEPIGPWQLAVGDVEPLYNCGAPQCALDTRRCPPELQVRDSEGYLHCLSVCQAVYSEPQRAKHAHLQALWEGRTARGKTRDLLCCTCGEGNGLCEALGSPCTYGCSPFVIGYTGPEYAVRKCQRIPGTFLPDWPNASTGENYAHVFDRQCPQAYSWQFNDDQSTYQCKAADYRVTFYAHPDVHLAHQPPAPSAGEAPKPPATPEAPKTEPAEPAEEDDDPGP